MVDVLVIGGGNAALCAALTATRNFHCLDCKTID